MDEVLEGLDCIFVYLDDILVASNTVEEHHIHLEEVFKRLQQHGLVLHLEKCVFFASSVEFLGQHVATIAAHPRSGTKSQLMSFLGMLNFYRRYVKGTASILKPLRNATRGAGSKLEWTKVMGKVFLAAKAAITDATHLAHPLQEAELSLAVDASNHHEGAALQQQSPGVSGSLSPSSAGSLPTPRRGTAPSIGSCWWWWPPWATSASCWRAAASTCSPTPSHWFLHSTEPGMHGQLARAATWPMWLSLPLTCTTWLEWTTWWQTAFPGPLRSSPCPGLPRWPV